MNIIETSIPDVLLIEPDLYTDSRGYFFESFSAAWFEENICCTKFIQDNESQSVYGVLRGLHYQTPPFAQSKLVRAVTGSVLDVAVDIRKGSPTYGKYVAEVLSEENKRMMFIPRGFAHGFVALSSKCLFVYKCDNYYSREHECSVCWNDPSLNINWQIPVEDIILSDKDRRNPLLKDAVVFNYFDKLY